MILSSPTRTRHSPAPSTTSGLRPPRPFSAPPEKGEPLPDPVRGKMERALGHDFSRVRVVEGEHVRRFGASAAAEGARLHFASGKYDPWSSRGQELIGHELAHVAQQERGRVKPTLFAPGLRVNDDPALEGEADRLGRTAARAEPASLFAPRPPAAPHRAAGAGAAPSTLQMNGDDWKSKFNDMISRHVYGPHEYHVTSPVYRGTDASKLNEAYEYIRRHPALGVGLPFGPVSEQGSLRFANPVGFIRAMAQPSERSITNTTTPFHALHRGSVTRTVVPSEAGVDIETHGTGHGILPSLNNALAPLYWNVAANLARAHIDPEHRERTRRLADEFMTHPYFP